MQVRQELFFFGLYQFDRRRPMIKIKNAVFSVMRSIAQRRTAASMPLAHQSAAIDVPVKNCSRICRIRAVWPATARVVMAAVSWLASLIHHHAILPVLPRSKEFLTGTHWIINNGSPATAMPPFDYLTDEEIWQLVIYLRSLVDHK
jgi:hypothetical protein